MKNLINKFFKEEEGNVIEYVIVLAVVAVIIVALFPGLRGKVINWFNTLIGHVDSGIGDGTSNGLACTKANGAAGNLSNGNCI
jgi:Flp pilus assembly pilin Flp